MGKSLTTFDPGAMPAHIAEFFDNKENDNIADRASVPTLAYGGKRWVITINGEKTPLVKKDDDGDDVPLAIMRVVILDYAKSRGRAYYEGTYDPNAVMAPVCWSDDGKKPNASIEEPQHPTCDGCPMAAKGSRITDQNKASVACSQHRMLAVVPSNRIDALPALRLKIAITSDWSKDDKDNQAKDWYAFQQYIDYLRSRGIKNTGAVISKIKFDGGTDYPKLLFQAGGWVAPEQLARIAEMAKEEDTLKLLGGSWTPAGADGKPVADKAKGKPLPDDEDDEDGPTAPAPKAAAKGKAKPAVVEDDDDDVIPPAKPSAKADKAKPVAAKVADDEDDEDEVPAAKAPAKAPATANPKRAAAVEAAAKAAATRKPVAVEDDDDEDEAPVAPKAAGKTKAAAPAVEEDDDDEAPPAKPTKAPKADKGSAPVSAAVPKGVSDLLSDWDDD